MRAELEIHNAQEKRPNQPVKVVHQATVIVQAVKLAVAPPTHARTWAGTVSVFTETSVHLIVNSTVIAIAYHAKKITIARVPPAHVPRGLHVSSYQ